MTKRRRYEATKRQSGFTLIELMIAIAILAFALISIMQVFVTCSALAESARNKSLAIDEAQGMIERIRNHDFDEIISDFILAGGGSCPCQDTLDNDGDGLIDFGGSGDNGCLVIPDPEDTTLPIANTSYDAEEEFECSDGRDNDGNGLIDYPSDPGCASSTDDEEGDLPNVEVSACRGTFTLSQLNGSGTIAIDANYDWASGSAYEIRVYDIQVTVTWTNRFYPGGSITLRTMISRR
jgi:prepilin-type N-terminal cleavage/methylation domain-containing protein